jgi:methyl-accepting chemotaxis protein
LTLAQDAADAAARADSTAVASDEIAELAERAAEAASHAAQRARDAAQRAAGFAKEMREGKLAGADETVVQTREVEREAREEYHRAEDDARQRHDGQHPVP